jgi:NAD(P)-dependent dehydrogenase (short-subunit alcohol dehydrogenase family)
MHTEIGNDQPAIFITGAASGIGRATAEYFAEKNWFVGACDINEDSLASLAAEIGPDKGHFARLDVTDRVAVAETLATFVEASGDRLDILFNNAGIDAKGSFEEMEWDRIMAVVDVNFIAGLGLIHTAIPHLRKTKGSLCMSTCSASATFGAGGMAVYSATKHAIKGLTEALATELAPHGVRVSDVLPGIIETGMLPDEVKAMLPKEGMWRMMPARAVAETLWAAYQGDKVHYYVPNELIDYDLEATRTPEAIRDRRAAGQPF